MSVDSIHAGLLAGIPDSYQKTVGFPTWVLLRAMAIGLDTAEQEIETARAALDPATLTGTALEQFIYYRTGQSRVQATFSAGSVTVTGTGTITAGDLFSTAGGVQFRAGETVAVDGTAQVLVSCMTPGAAGNVAAATITQMPVQIPGISAVTNPQPITGGYDAEDDKSLLERFLTRLQNPPNGANAWQYREWALEVPGVGDARVFPLGHGENTVDVVVIDSDGKPAGSDLVDEVQEYIDPDSAGAGQGKAMIGAHCYVSAAEAVAVSVSVSVRRITGAAEDGTTQAVTDAVAAYLRSVAFQQNYVSYARIGEAILGAAGVQDYENLKVNGAVANVTVTERQVAVPGEVTITYVS
ncbi:MAG: baseplate J/gp47 family protein [Clostridiales bacterium]|nr:baseplate J/gp47 family protein [Clostridiales bacterium]